MIELSKLNGKHFVLNAEYIETIEETPDTVITLTNGKKIMVKDNINDVVKSVIRYKQLCNQTIEVLHKKIE
jgi:flagellar protein FlbD